jgi:hypothetical protein
MHPLIPSFVLAALMTLGACTHTAQTSSGADYLARYDAAMARTAAAPTTRTHASSLNDSGDQIETRLTPDEMVRLAASVEPILTFPARFGLARLDRGKLVGIPTTEMALWSTLIEKNRSLGEFVAINPLIAEFTSNIVRQPRRADSQQNFVDTVTKIRLGAARQHVDAVLIYEVGAVADRNFTPLYLADLTIIGGTFLPTRSIEAKGVASALLLDVRNGYPYGNASAISDLSGLSTTFGKEERTEDLRQAAALQGVENLVPEVEAMISELVVKMAAQVLAHENM